MYNGSINMLLKEARMAIKNVAFFTNTEIRSAIEHLRVLAPLQSVGVEVTRYILTNNFDFDDVKPCQIIIIQRELAGNYLQYKRLVDFSNQIGVPIILDLDDNLLELPANHPDRLSHYYTDSLLPLLQSITDVDAITVTTKTLQKELSKYNKSVYLLPNYVDDSLWKFKAPKSHSNDDDLKIIYMGSQSHKPDFDLVANALEIVLNIYPRLSLYAYGVQLPDSLQNHPKAYYIPSETIDYESFASYFHAKEMDIAIAPLSTTSFNNYKSPLKFYEYSVNGLPGVYSKVGPYIDAIEHGKTGLLSDNETNEWVKHLEALITDADLQKRIVNQAQEKIRSENLLSKNSYRWLEVYEEILINRTNPLSSITLSLPQLSEINVQIFEATEEKRKLIKELTADNNSLNVMVSELKEQNAQNDALTKEQAERIDALTKEQAERIDALTKEQAERIDALTKEQAERIDALTKEQAERIDALTKEQEALKTAKDDHIAKLVNESSMWKAEASRLTEEINDYVLSTSWRITRVFRKIKKIMRGRSNV